MTRPYAEPSTWPQQQAEDRADEIIAMAKRMYEAPGSQMSPQDALEDAQHFYDMVDLWKARFMQSRIADTSPG